MKPRIGIDLMGGDHSAETLLPELLKQMDPEEKESLELVLFAPAENLGRYPGITCVEANDTILPHESPLTAIRTKKETSIAVGMRYLRDGMIDAFVSIGNTAALVGTARLTLPMIEGIKRAALLALLPTKKKPIAVIDVGATVDSKAEHLVQFAGMGIAYQRCRGIENPKLALLNIGSEEKKGSQETISAFQQLQGLSGFVGNIESRDAFHGTIDVLVTDGFAGNILLKTAEGMASFIFEHLAQVPAMGNLIAKLEQNLDYAQYPGAILCGVDGLVVKCHGYSNSLALLNGIRGAVSLVKEGFIAKLKKELGIR